MGNFLWFCPINCNSAAALFGPILLSSLRNYSYQSAIRKLAMECDPQVFENTFGAPISKLEELINAKTVTIPHLMEIVPPHVIDPTPFLYDTSMYAMAFLLSSAFVCNAFIRPVAVKHFLKK